MSGYNETPEVLARGTVSSSGRATGHARIIDPEPQFGTDIDSELPVTTPEDILVTPAFYPYMKKEVQDAAGFIITEEQTVGGRGSVVARGYDVPAIVNCPYLLDRVNTGDLITVASSSGCVYRWRRSTSETNPEQ